MRNTLAAALLFLTSLASAQAPSGSFKRPNAPAVDWRVNEHNALYWGADPCVPFGLRIKGSASAVHAAKAAGIRDLIVELPSNGMGWKDALAALELDGMRYWIAIDSLAPGATGIAVEPQSYRIAGITGKRSIDVSMPGVTAAYVVLALKRDASITMSKRVQVVGERLQVDVDASNGLEHVLLIYPETSAASLVDAWDAFDEHRDALLAALKTASTGQGMRGVINPVGAMIPQTAERPFVPTSPRFRAEFEAFLEQKYRNVQSVQRAWSTSANDANTFADLARLIPLWSGTRGVQFLWDPKSDALIAVESKKSIIWADIRAVLAAAEARRVKRLTQAIKKTCDVPIVQDFVGWSTLYEQSNPNLDGLGARTEGVSFSSLMDQAARAASSTLRWTRPGWLIASSIDLRGQQGVPISGIADDLASCGVRGFFFVSNDPAQLALIAQEAAKRRDDPALCQWSPNAVYFPENALNPANIQRLPGGKWWLPTPYAGNRIPLGDLFTAYRLDSPSGTTYALWSSVGVQRIRLRMAEPDKATFQAIDGLDPAPKISKKLGLEINIGPNPTLITSEEIPIPQPCVDEIAVKFAQLIKEAERLRVDASEEGFAFRDALQSFDRNPGGSFSQMMLAFQRLNGRLARYMWIEAERFKDSSFSESLVVPGASGGAVLTLRSPFEGQVADYFAEYAFPSRSGEELEVWIAARIPKEFRNAVTVIIGSQMLKISGEPVSFYGAGYGWYRLGVTRLGGVQSTVQIRVLPDAGIDLAIDSLLFCPGQFTPRGIRQPDAIVFTSGTKKDDKD